MSEISALSQFTDILRDDALVSRVFDEALFLAWKDSVGGQGLGLPFGDCAAFSLPLFLGGKAEPAKMEQADMDLTWTMGAQIWEQVRHLPPGTPVCLGL